MSASHALPRRAVLADVLPGARVRDAILIVSGALLTALFAQIAIDVPPSPVPITGQTLAVGLVGATLGARRGAASLALYVLLGLVFPFYADGESGWHVVWGASGGYLIGFVFAAAFVGWMAEHGADRSPLLAFVTFVVGQSWGWTIHNGFSIFIVGGLVKAAVGAAVLPSAWGLVRRFER
jgi:biotin transport system substrate-specific component